MKGKFAEMEKQRQEEERKRMEEERKKREAQDNMEKAKIKKELAKKAVEVSKLYSPGVNSWYSVSALTGKWGSMSKWFSTDFLIRKYLCCNDSGNPQLSLR